MWIIKILQYKKIDVSDEIDVNKTSASNEVDVNKTSASKECELCHYWFFKDVEFKFEEHICNKCLDLLTMAHSLIM